jgi:hypothetical protein
MHVYCVRSVELALSLAAVLTNTSGEVLRMRLAQILHIFHSVAFASEDRSRQSLNVMYLAPLERSWGFLSRPSFHSSQVNIYLATNKPDKICRLGLFGKPYVRLVYAREPTASASQVRCIPYHPLVSERSQRCLIPDLAHWARVVCPVPKTAQ